MVLKPDQQRVQTLLNDTITLLCKNGLSYKNKFCISALIGITLDEDDVFLVDIRETVQTAEDKSDSSDNEVTVAKGRGNSRIATTSPPRKRKRRKRKSSSEESDYNDNGTIGKFSDDEYCKTVTHVSEKPKELSAVGRTLKQEIAEGEDDDSQDLVFIKDEPMDHHHTNSSSVSSYTVSTTRPLSSGQQQPGVHHQGGSGGADDDILGNLAQHGQLYATPASGETQLWDPGQPPGGGGGDASFTHPPSSSSSHPPPPHSSDHASMQQQQQLESITFMSNETELIKNTTCMGNILYELIPPSGVYIDMNTYNQVKSSGPNYNAAYRAILRGVFTREELSQSTACGSKTRPGLNKDRLNVCQHFIIQSFAVEKGYHELTAITNEVCHQCRRYILKKKKYQPT